MRRMPDEITAAYTGGQRFFDLEAPAPIFNFQAQKLLVKGDAHHRILDAGMAGNIRQHFLRIPIEPPTPWQA